MGHIRCYPHEVIIWKSKFPPYWYIYRLIFVYRKKHQRKEKTLWNPRNVSTSLVLATVVNVQHCLCGTIGDGCRILVLLSMELPGSADGLVFFNMEISNDSILLDDRWAASPKPLGEAFDIPHSSFSTSLVSKSEMSAVFLNTLFEFVPFCTPEGSMLNTGWFLEGCSFVLVKDPDSTTFDLLITGKFLAFVRMCSNIVSSPEVLNAPSPGSRGSPASVEKNKKHND